MFESPLKSWLFRALKVPCASLTAICTKPYNAVKIQAVPSVARLQVNNFS